MEKKGIYQKLHAIMSEAKTVVKEDRKVNNQYRFVSHDAVTQELHPLLVKHGVLILPKVLEVRQDGNRTEAKYLIEFLNVEDPTDVYETVAVGYGIDSQDKGPGKAVSYALKTTLLKVFFMQVGDEGDNERELIDYKPGQQQKKKEKISRADAFQFVLSEGSYKMSICEIGLEPPALEKYLINYGLKYKLVIPEAEKCAIRTAIKALREDLSKLQRLETERAAVESFDAGKGGTYPTVEEDEIPGEYIGYRK